MAAGRGRRGDRRGAVGGLPVTRLLREHPAIDAELDAAGRLVAFRWNGRREPVEVCNRWRVEESWWREPIARDYFKVVGPELARARLPRPGRRHVAPGAAVRLEMAATGRIAEPMRRSRGRGHAQGRRTAGTASGPGGDDGPSADGWRSERDRHHEQHEEHADDEGERPEVSRSSRLHRCESPSPVTGLPAGRHEHRRRRYAMCCGIAPDGAGVAARSAGQRRPARGARRARPARGPAGPRPGRRPASAPCVRLLELVSRCRSRTPTRPAR